VSVGDFESLNLATHVGDDPRAVDWNRARILEWTGAQALVTLSAVHGADVVIVDDKVIAASRTGRDPVADALICQRDDVAVLALGADCLTIGIAGDDNQTVAAVHCGWRGLANDVVGATVRTMESLGTRPAHVVLGPAVCGACYPVSPDRVDDLRRDAPDGVAEAGVMQCPDGQPGIDVRAGVRKRLESLGLPATAVTSIDLCTVEEADLFSYRRDGRTGRQGIVVARAGRMVV
jgi:YfiH family protein